MGEDVLALREGIGDQSVAAVPAMAGDGRVWHLITVPVIITREIRRIEARVGTSPVADGPRPFDEVCMAE